MVMTSLTSTSVSDSILADWNDQMTNNLHSYSNLVENVIVDVSNINSYVNTVKNEVNTESSDENENSCIKSKMLKSRKIVDNTNISRYCSRYNSSNRISGGAFNNLPASSRQTTFGSSLLDGTTDEPTSSILNYCKRNFLRPYSIILSLVGLGPKSTDINKCQTYFSYLHVLLMIILLIFGNFLQYLCSYRGDIVFSRYKISTSSPKSEISTIGYLLFGYIIPNMMNATGFLSAVYFCKTSDNEHLQNLVERAFLMSNKPKRLCRSLWTYVISGFILFSVTFGFALHLVIVQSQVLQIKWILDILNEMKLVLKFILLVNIFLKDFIEIIVLISYILQCVLLRIHLLTLSYKLFMHSIDSLDWMREILEFRKMLDYFNRRVALPVCFFIIMNLSYAFAAIIYFIRDFDFNYLVLNTILLNVIYIFLWLTMGLLPFFFAASLTESCQVARNSGHQIRVRPFLYNNSLPDELNSILLFASSLDMSAKLFSMPIKSNYLCFAIMTISVILVTAGMCYNL